MKKREKVREKGKERDEEEKEEEDWSCSRLIPLRGNEIVCKSVAVERKWYTVPKRDRHERKLIHFLTRNEKAALNF